MSNKMQQLVSSIAQMVENNEKIAVPVLAAKLTRLAVSNPNDQTIVMAADVVSKLSGRTMFMSKAELRTLYNKLHTRNTKFAEYFGEEMGAGTELATPQFAPKQEAPLANLYESSADPVLANALASVFDNTIPLKMYSKEIAAMAKFAVSSNLDAWNLKASRLEVESGNEHFIVVKADYDTPKGITSILVPVEVAKGKALEPSVFMANAGPQDLNHVNIKNYITSFAGKNLKVRASDVVDTLTAAVTTPNEVSDAEMALTKLTASKAGTSNFSGGQVVGLKVTAEPRNVVLDLPQTTEVDSFAAKFESPAGMANLRFGAAKVTLGRDVVARTITTFGFAQPQVTVMGNDETSVYYAVSLYDGRTAFRVPVKFAGNRAVYPDVMICNGTISEFTRENVNSLLVNDETDSKVAAVASPQYSLKPSELVDNVRVAMSEGNLSKAEDALNILKQQGDEKAYVSAFALYVNSLGMTKEASPECKCSLVIKTANSKHPVCGHTNLPVHKVYQDEHGNCRPLYRRGMDETYEGNFFLHSKIFG